MNNRSSVWLGMALCSVQLLSAGCGGGGGGLFGLFGGSGDSGAGDLFSALVSGGSDVAGGAGGGRSSRAISEVPRESGDTSRRSRDAARQGQLGFPLSRG